LLYARTAATKKAGEKTSQAVCLLTDIALATGTIDRCVVAETGLRSDKDVPKMRGLVR
jgi:hypothetical protein